MKIESVKMARVAVSNQDDENRVVDIKALAEVQEGTVMAVTEGVVILTPSTDLLTPSPSTDLLAPSPSTDLLAPETAETAGNGGISEEPPVRLATFQTYNPAAQQLGISFEGACDRGLVIEAVEDFISSLMEGMADKLAG